MGRRAGKYLRTRSRPEGGSPYFCVKDERTYEFCFDGTEEDKTVAVGTHECIKQTEDKEVFKSGKQVTA